MVMPGEGGEQALFQNKTSKTFVQFWIIGRIRRFLEVRQLVQVFAQGHQGHPLKAYSIEAIIRLL